MLNSNGKLNFFLGAAERTSKPQFRQSVEFSLVRRFSLGEARADEHRVGYFSVACELIHYLRFDIFNLERVIHTGEKHIGSWK